MTSQRDVSLPINAIAWKVGTLRLHAALARSRIRVMNAPAADHAGNAAAAESAAPAAGVDTLFAQVYDRLKGMPSRQAAGVGATPEVVDTHISRKLWTPFPAGVHVEAPVGAAASSRCFIKPKRSASAG